MIYFIRSHCKQFIKIGYTKDLDRRVKEFQTATPKKIKVLGVIDGTTTTESSLHELFKKYRETGEWFRNQGDVKALQMLLTNGCDDCPYELSSVRGIQKSIAWLRTKQAANRQAAKGKPQLKKRLSRYS